MKEYGCHTILLDFSQWQILDQTLMVLNSS
jgi:hypothetical protein